MTVNFLTTKTMLVLTAASFFLAMLCFASSAHAATGSNKSAKGSTKLAPITATISRRGRHRVLLLQERKKHNGCVIPKKK